VNLDEGNSKVRRLFSKTLYFYRRNGLRAALRRAVSLISKDRVSIFTDIYKNSLWGKSESLSGIGSSELATREIRAHLPVILSTWNLKSIVDAPCGDFNWMKLLTLAPDVNYTGIDIVPDLISNNIKKYEDSQHRLILADLAADPLPKGDIVLCRDCLFHFSYNDIFLFLKNSISSGTPFLLTTTHKNDKEFQNVDVLTGEFRLLDLFSAPFSLPTDVVYRFDDFISPQPPREMCLWNRDQIITAVASSSRGSALVAAI
jgi:hypothetical protein